MGNDFFIVRQTILTSTPKYSWIKTLRIPPIFIHGISGYLRLTAMGILLLASPITSRFLTTASITISFFLNWFKVIPFTKDSILSIARRISWIRKTQSLEDIFCFL